MLPATKGYAYAYIHTTGTTATAHLAYLSWHGDDDPSRLWIDINKRGGDTFIGCYCGDASATVNGNIVEAGIDDLQSFRGFIFVSWEDTYQGEEAVNTTHVKVGLIAQDSNGIRYEDFSEGYVGSLAKLIGFCGIMFR